MLTKANSESYRQCLNNSYKQLNKFMAGKELNEESLGKFIVAIKDGFPSGKPKTPAYTKKKLSWILTYLDENNIMKYNEELYSNLKNKIGA